MFEKTIAFLTIGTLNTFCFLVVEVSVFWSCVAGVIGGGIACYLRVDLNKEKEYRFKFQQHPFDDGHFFSVQADSQGEANDKAREVFARLVDEGKTVMRTFYPVT